MSGWQLVSFVALGSFGLGPAALALPHPDEPIDPTKQAPVSTSNAVKPSTTPVNGSGVVGGRVIRMSEIPLRRATVNGDRAAIDVHETRTKDHVIKPSARTETVRKFDVSRASERPATIPRIDAERFHRMLREYEEDRVPAAEMLASTVQVGNETVDLGEINRFVNPRAALEAQGIPVHSAGAGETAGPVNTNVPVSAEKNGGDPSASAAAPAATPAR